MDTIFLIKKDNKSNYYGANHFGYTDTILKATKLLIKDFLTEDEKNFLKTNLYLIDGSRAQDIEVYLDLDAKLIYLDCYYIESLKAKEESFVSFKEAKLLTKEKLKYQEFTIVADFIFQHENSKRININNEFILHISHS